MDIVSAISFLGGWFTIGAGILLEGAHLEAFIKLSAFLIIFGGSFFASTMGYTMSEMMKIPMYVKDVFIMGKERADAEMVNTFVTFSEKARREGLLALEDDLEEITDPFLRKGLQLVIDGTDPGVIEDILSQEIQSQANREKVGAEFFMDLGGYSPTMGIIGTVAGLMHVLQNLGNASAAQLGHGIALAFVATFYGIAFANLWFLPMNKKAEYRIKQSSSYRNMILAGILTIQSGDNPRIVQDRLKVYVDNEGERKKLEEQQDQR